MISERIEAGQRERRVRTRVPQAAWRPEQGPGGNRHGRWLRPAPRAAAKRSAGRTSNSPGGVPGLDDRIAQHGTRAGPIDRVTGSRRGLPDQGRGKLAALPEQQIASVTRDGCPTGPCPPATRTPARRIPAGSSFARAWACTRQRRIDMTDRTEYRTNIRSSEYSL
jgi:hypothetical protein